VTPLLKLESVNVTFWRGVRSTEVLRDVSLELHEGEFGGIWGRRGSGKTTLVRVAAGVLAPDSGTVVFDGRPLRGPDRDGTLLAQIGLANRHGPEMNDMDAMTWITSTLVHLSSWRDARRRARTALDRVGLGDAAHLPWHEMSDGERMLAAVAQAMARRPRLIVVDDPVAGLGGRDRADILDLLRGIATDGVAVLVTAAELAEIHGLDQIWAFDSRGRLDGPPRRRVADVVPLRANDHH
jgi:ABC-type multidrug transport system ATPase subunit